MLRSPSAAGMGTATESVNRKDNCPSSMLEVGSNTEHCKNNNYQATCCTYNTPRMKLYSQCKWDQPLDCDEGTCSNSLVAYSSAGSGGDFCSYQNVRNFKIDITRTDQAAYICAIHWQVAQGTSLENIYFYMTQDASTTQQGIYMENGSGGFMSDLTFVGRNFGAYLGNQQFTTSHLVFVNCNTALQIHWDWAWTMQDVVIESCTTGIIIVSGAGGPFSTGQAVGSFALVDAIIANTATRITTTLYNKNSTALLLQNIGFYNTQNTILDSNVNKALIPGGDQTILDSWGFGMVNDPEGARFVSSVNLQAANHSLSLVGDTVYNVGRPNFFNCRRPKYNAIGNSHVLDVEALGAKGDGKTDDTIVLNSVLARGANISSIVFFPYSIYVIKDTLKIPQNSRILGQAWSQIMAIGSKFEDVRNPRVAVKVGNKGDVGIVEIQDLLFTVSGPTAGTVLVEWNIHKSSQGADSHFRVGGAAGSALQAKDCPKGGGVNEACIAAALMLRLTHRSSAYLENIWVWTADHDLDVASQDQIDVYSARGLLIESQGPTWLYRTASEHQVFYQYKLYQAKDIVLGDPDFSNCMSTSTAYTFAWGMRILDSSSVHLLGAGFYSWFSDYSQDCVDKDYCQDRIFQIKQSYNIWIYNLITKAALEMVSPVGQVPTYAKDNKNSFLSSLLAWVRGPKEVVGGREIRGFYIWNSNSDSDSDALKGLPNACQTSLTQLVKCDPYATMFLDNKYRGSLNNMSLTDSVCNDSCGASLQSWFHNIETNCADYNVSGSAATKYSGQVWSGWNRTCLKDPTSGEYCNNEIAGFTPVDFLQDMPKDKLCSFCFVKRLEIMQHSPYSFYNKSFQIQLEVVNAQCGLSAPTAMPPSLDAPPEFPPDPICASNQTHTTVLGDTCDSIALAHSVSSAALVMANSRHLMICDNLPADMDLCLPTSCSGTYQLKSNDTCSSIERASFYAPGTVRKYNAWVAWDCSNLQTTTEAWGHVICLEGQGGNYTATAPIPGVTLAPGEGNSGYSGSVVDPLSNATVAEGTSLKCGKWYMPAEDKSCARICLAESITFALFTQVNPLLQGEDCSAALVVGNAYCVAPNPGWAGSQPPVASSSAVPSPN
ncbi:pectate lyase superfamily protein-domain-containing protein [Aspergillus navahoensis]